MLASPASSNATLPGAGSIWGKLTGKGGKKDTPPPPPAPAPAAAPQMALTRQRLLTLVYGDMETVRMLPPTFQELEVLARDWTKPPPDAVFTLRVPIDYVHIQTARLVSGDFVYLTGEDSYQIATMGVPGLRVEIVSDGPPPVDEPPPPPPPPVLDMPATFNLELMPGQMVALDTVVSSDELDMARMEDGTVVDGTFWGKLVIVHDGDNHNMEFSGTRIVSDDMTPSMLVDSRVVAKLADAAKPPVAKCRLTLLTPEMQYCDIFLHASQYWKIVNTWPPAEPQDEEGRFKYFLRVHPGGGFEHFDTEMVATSIYYEAMPDGNLLEPTEFIAPRNSFAMPFSDFVPHIMRVLEQLGMSVHARSEFINMHIHDFSKHKNIAYRFLSPARIAAAVDLSATIDPCVFTRLFLIFRGISEDEMGIFAGATEKEANIHNWRQVVGWSEDSKDTGVFRILETAVLEVG